MDCRRLRLLPRHNQLLRVCCCRSSAGAQRQRRDSQVGQQSDQAEKDVTAEAAQQDSGAPSASRGRCGCSSPRARSSHGICRTGSNTDQVKAALGEPTRIANLGPKVIYYYNGMKVTFKDGKVSDVE